MDKVAAVTLQMRRIIKDHPQGFLLECNEYLYQEEVDSYNREYNKAYNGNRGIVLVAVVFVLLVIAAVVAALNL